MTRRKFPWHELNERFDHVHIKSDSGETLTAKSVSSPALSHVLRRFGPGSVVVTSTVPDGVVVFLAYVPPKVVEEAPSPALVTAPKMGLTPEKRAQLEREQEEHDRLEAEREDRELAEQDSIEEDDEDPYAGD